jgi:hypothetical protein
LKGEVVKSPHGRIDGAVPPIGMPGAIRFEIFGEYPGQNPPWADMQLEVEGRLIKCRINPKICRAPFFRLWDCVNIVAEDSDKFPLIESGNMATTWFPPQPHPDSQQFVFVRAFMGQLVLIDTYARAKQFDRR